MTKEEEKFIEFIILQNKFRKLAIEKLIYYSENVKIIPNLYKYLNVSTNPQFNKSPLSESTFKYTMLFDTEDYSEEFELPVSVLFNNDWFEQEKEKNKKSKEKENEFLKDPDYKEYVRLREKFSFIHRPWEKDV